MGMGKLQEAIKCGYDESIKYRDMLVKNVLEMNGSGEVPKENRDTYRFFFGNSLMIRYDVAMAHKKMKDIDDGLALIQQMLDMYQQD